MHSRANLLAAVAVGLSVLSGCNCSENLYDPGKDAGIAACEPACPSGQTCEATSLTCVKALKEGQVCRTAADGSPVEGACEEGLTCGLVGTLERCSKACTSADADKVCGVSRQCFARPKSSAGFCGTAASEGQSCGDVELLKCSGGTLVCVNSGEETLGRCFRACDPTTPDPNPACTADQSCAEVLPDEPTRGVCVVPAGHYPAKCDHATLAYCGRGETCVRPGAETWGYCHRRCAATSLCTGEEVCAQPSAGLSICVVPVARCQDSEPTRCAQCLAIEDQYCGLEDLCVRLGKAPAESTVCKQDCTATRTCPSGTCSAVTGTDRYVCLE